MVKRFYLVSFFVFVLGVNSVTQGQIASDLSFIMRNNQIDPAKGKEPSLFTFNQTNELKIGLMGLIRVYQKFLSTQDLSVCNFTPSCSRFAMASFKNYGIFYGILMTSDRLQRCQAMGRKYYPVNPETGKCDDPIEPNFLGHK